MGSKTLLLFFISFAIVLAITSQVAARELAEASTSVDNFKKPPIFGDPRGPIGNPGEGWHHDGGYGGGGGGGYGGGGGGRYGGYPGQAVDAEP